MKRVVKLVMLSFCDRPCVSSSQCCDYYRRTFVYTHCPQSNIITIIDIASLVSFACQNVGLTSSLSLSACCIKWAVMEWICFCGIKIYFCAEKRVFLTVRIFLVYKQQSATLSFLMIRDV